MLGGGRYQDAADRQEAFQWCWLLMHAKMASHRQDMVRIGRVARRTHVRQECSDREALKDMAMASVLLHLVDPVLRVLETYWSATDDVDDETSVFETVSELERLIGADKTKELCWTYDVPVVHAVAVLVSMGRLEDVCRTTRDRTLHPGCYIGEVGLSFYCR